MTLKIAIIAMAGVIGFLILWNIVFYLDFRDMQKEIKKLMEKD